MSVELFLEQLYCDGRRNDETATCRDDMMLNITPSTGRFLDLLVCDAKPKRILELGTSNGYSTIWLGRAASRIGAVVETVEASSGKVHAATANLAKCRLTGSVVVHHCDAGDFLQRCSDHEFDFIFLDSDRSRYQEWSSDLIRVLRFGLMVVDNAISHPTEMIGFRHHLSHDLGLSVSVLPIGKGQMVVQDVK